MVSVVHEPEALDLENVMRSRFSDQEEQSCSEECLPLQERLSCEDLGDSHCESKRTGLRCSF